MKVFSALLLAAVFSFTPDCFAGPDKTLVAARDSILSSTITPQGALVKYVTASKATNAAPVMAEYAYALAYAGLGEAALYNIDRAIITEPLIMTLLHIDYFGLINHMSYDNRI